MLSGPSSQAHSKGGTTSTALLLTRSKLPDVCDATMMYKLPCCKKLDCLPPDLDVPTSATY